MTEPLKAVDGPGPDEARLTPFRLAPKFAARIWGKTDLRPWYAETGIEGNVGEAWLTGPECVVETGEHTGKAVG